MTQYGRPDETLVEYNDWSSSGGNQLWSEVDEVTAEDNDYIYVNLPFTAPYGGYGAIAFGLSDVSTPNSEGHALRWRARRGAHPVNLNAVYLVPGDISAVEEIVSEALASKNLEDAPTTSWVESVWTLSTAQVSAISQHYDNLGVAFWCAEGGGDTPRLSMSWIEFLCPDAYSSTTINTGPWVSEKTWESTATWEATSDATTSDNNPWTPWPPTSNWTSPSITTDVTGSSVTADASWVWTTSPYFGPNYFGPSYYGLQYFGTGYIGVQGTEWPSGTTLGSSVVTTASSGVFFSPWFRASAVTDSEWGVDFVLKVNDQFPDYVSDVQPLTVWDSPITEGI